MRKRFLGAMLLALGIGLFGGWGSAQANSAPESTQSMLHVCWLKDAHVNPAAVYSKHAACVLAEGCSC